MRSYLLLKTSLISCNCLQGKKNSTEKNNQKLSAHPGTVLCQKR